LNLSPLLRYLEATVSTGYDIDSYDNDDDDDDDSNNNYNDTNNKHDGDKFREYDVHDDNYDKSKSTANVLNHDDNNDKSKSTANVLTTTKLQQKFHKLTSSLCELLDDYGLVSYLPMSIEDGSMVGRVLAATDNANGYR
jgi:hypothetical protein